MISEKVSITSRDIYNTINNQSSELIKTFTQHHCLISKALFLTELVISGLLLASGLPIFILSIVMMNLPIAQGKPIRELSFQIPTPKPTQLSSESYYWHYILTDMTSTVLTALFIFGILIYIIKRKFYFPQCITTLY